MRYNLSLTVFTQRNFVADFFQASAILDGNRHFCVFDPIVGLGCNVRWSSLAHWKARSRLSVNSTFFATC